MTTIKMTNGKELKVNGTVEQIVKNYSSKPNTEITESRINENLTIWVNGKNVGEIVTNG